MACWDTSTEWGHHYCYKLNLCYSNDNKSKCVLYEKVYCINTVYRRTPVQFIVEKVKWHVQTSRYSKRKWKHLRMSVRRNSCSCCPWEAQDQGLDLQWKSGHRRAVTMTINMPKSLYQQNSCKINDTARFMEASMKVAWVLGKHKKPFSDTELTKECCDGGNARRKVKASNERENESDTNLRFFCSKTRKVSCFASGFLWWCKMAKFISPWINQHGWLFMTMIERGLV